MVAASDSSVRAPSAGRVPVAGRAVAALKGATSLLVKGWLFQMIKSLPEVNAAPFDGRVHPQPVPDEYQYPFVTFYREAAAEFGPIGGPTTSSTFRYVVKVVDDRPDTERLEPVYNAINQLLDGADGYADDSTYLTCECVGELITDLTTEEDKDFSQLGGFYEFFVGQG